MLINCDTVYKRDIVSSGTVFFRAWKRRHGRAVKLSALPGRDGTTCHVTASVPHSRLEYGTADIELAVLIEDYSPESFRDYPTEHGARRAARRADGYDPESDTETVTAAAARIARAPASSAIAKMFVPRP